MVTNSSYKLIMGKEKIDFFLFHLGSYLEFFLTEMLIEYFSTFHTTFFSKSVNLIGCRCCKKGQFS